MSSGMPRWPISRTAERSAIDQKRFGRGETESQENYDAARRLERTEREEEEEHEAE